MLDETYRALDQSSIDLEIIVAKLEVTPWRGGWLAGWLGGWKGDNNDREALASPINYYFVLFNWNNDICVGEIFHLEIVKYVGKKKWVSTGNSGCR